MRFKDEMKDFLTSVPGKLLLFLFGIEVITSCFSNGHKKLKPRSDHHDRRVQNTMIVFLIALFLAGLFYINLLF